MKERGEEEMEREKERGREERREGETEDRAIAEQEESQELECH